MTPLKAIILGVVMVALLGGIAAAVILTRQNQDIRSKADSGTGSTTTGTGSTGTTTGTGATNQAPSDCAKPSQVTNVSVEYPACTGVSKDNCNFNQGSCSWTAATDATKYNVKITQVDSGKVIQDSSVDAPTTQVTFAVEQNKTYRCDISTVNSCGSVGDIGTDSLLCSVGGVFPGASATATPSATLAPTPAPISCGNVGCGTKSPCQTGFVCVQAASGQSYCANASYRSACQQSPGVNTCCVAPTPAPTPTPLVPKALPKSADTDLTTLLGFIGIGLLGVSGAIALFQMMKARR